MKRIISLMAVILIIAGSMTFGVSAAVFSKGDLNIDIPENLISDDVFALEFDLTKSWVSEDGNFAVGISVEDNTENYTYVNYSDKDIQNIYKGYIEGDDEDCYTLDKGENIKVGEFEGIRLDMTIDYEGEISKHTVCAFSTKETVYTLYFYVYDNNYMSYIDEIINSVSITGKSYDAELEGNIQYVVYLAVVFAISGISALIKKSKAKKKSPSAVTAQPVVYTPPVENGEANVETVADEAVTVAENVQSETKNKAEGFAAKEAEKERKEREKMFD